MPESAAKARVAVPNSRLSRLSLAQRLVVGVFLVVGVWYLAWRPSTFNPQAPVFSLAIYAAEAFGFFLALLYITMCWRLRERTSLPVPEGATTAVFIPTINESVDIVRRTVMAALRMQHATEVWLLDDGDRLEMQVLAQELGCRYLSRTENTHAKAGNLNNALQYTRCDYIAIFDADHAPTSRFLEETLGFFADPCVAFVQTPQDFYNLDSFQHRQGDGDAVVWSEQTLFFRIIQPGKDNLGAAFFCGSCAVIRRAAVESIGGFATETVTEDLHTSLKLHKRGWKSVYYARSLAFGVAPASAIPFLKQRLRWGQGAMQVWRREGILFTRGLTLGQRAAYLATMLAYFEGWQRLVFFLAPAIVLATGVLPILQLNTEFLLHFLPYYLLTFCVFEEVARGHGRTLLTEQYNMVRFAVFITATFGFFMRRLRFVVTPKQMGVRDATRRMLWPQYVVLGLNAAAIPAGLALQGGTLPPAALAANVAWAAITIAIAVVAIRHALRKSSHQRREYRFPLPVAVRLRGEGSPGDGQVALATDLSPLGCRITGARNLSQGSTVEGLLMLPSGPLPFSATVRAQLTAPGDAAGATLGCEFRWASADERNALEQFLFGSDLQWEINGYRERVPTPLERFAGMLRLADPVLERRVALADWVPAFYRDAAGSQGEGIGFISRPAPGASERYVMSLAPLPAQQDVELEEVTGEGTRHVQGRPSDERTLEAHGSPIYLYRLSA